MGDGGRTRFIVKLFYVEFKNQIFSPHLLMEFTEYFNNTEEGLPQAPDSGVFRDQALESKTILLELNVSDAHSGGDDLDLSSETMMK